MTQKNLLPEREGSQHCWVQREELKGRAICNMIPLDASAPKMVALYLLGSGARAVRWGVASPAACRRTKLRRQTCENLGHGSLRRHECQCCSCHHGTLGGARAGGVVAETRIAVAAAIAPVGAETAPSLAPALVRQDGQYTHRCQIALRGRALPRKPWASSGGRSRPTGPSNARSGTSRPQRGRVGAGPTRQSGRAASDSGLAGERPERTPSSGVFPRPYGSGSSAGGARLGLGFAG